MAGAQTEGCARLFAAACFTGQSTSSQSGVRGQRSVAVVEAPAFPGTIAAFLRVYMAALTNVKRRSRSKSGRAIDATFPGAAAARNPWEGDASAPSCRPYELFHA